MSVLEAARHNRAFAETWNGTSWAISTPTRTATPRPDDALFHVACTSTQHCVAVGIRFNPRHKFSNHTLIEVWDGTTWKIQNSVNP